MLRLTVLTRTKQEVVLSVDGWVAGAGVALLEEEGARALSEADCLVLDLTQTRFIDGEGLALLRRWWGRGLVLRGGALFLRQILRSHGLDALPAAGE